jgi:energy-coupling factor transport system ATP-binding protein
MINIKQLSFQYPQTSHKVLDNVTLDIPEGTLTLVTGASGSGKSTLLRCINGLVPHFSGGVISGEIRVFGSDPIGEGVAVMAGKVGFVFQEPEAQFVFDTVEDEIVFSLENMGMSREDMDRSINQVLYELGLSDLRHRKINTLSGGEQQKVSIASALVAHPKVLVLDEPTSQLDPISADEVLKFMLDLKSQQNLTVLISEHRLERLLPYADLILNLAVNKTIHFGDPQQVLPEMDQVPPIIEIAQRFGLSPLPLTPETFPKISTDLLPSSNKQSHYDPTNKAEILLSVQKLINSFENRTILKEVDLDLQGGEILVLMGPNGSGKTTFLRSVLKLIPSSGDIFLNGVAIKNLHFSEVIQNIAYLPQNPNDLLFAESIIDELKITLKNHGRDFNSINYSKFLEHFGLADKGSQYPRDLSVGERQRTALAAITVHDPKIIFLDEPTRGLDYHAKRSLSGLFQQWRGQGKAILLVTHDVEFAAQLADRVAVLKRGQFIFVGSPADAFTKIHGYQTQTAQLFPNKGWITPKDIENTTKPSF